MAPDNNILQPFAFASKHLSSAEKRYRNIEGEALGILHGLEKIPLLLLCKIGKYKYRPQTAGSNI